MSSRAQLARARRIVVKLGTGVVTHEGARVALGRLHAVVEDLADLRARGVDVVLVSSGAVSMGAHVLKLPERPNSLGIRQACAAVGQGHLLALYAQAFGQLGHTVGQVLLTAEDLEDRDRALCVRTTLLRLLALGTIAVLNENDSVSVRELVEHRGAEFEGFGDNDGLSARVAVAVDADALVVLTDIDGVHTANPATDPRATRIGFLPGVDAQTRARARGRSATGTGGMTSKLEAARLTNDAGIPCLILSGSTPRAVSRALAGEDLGTLIAVPATRAARKRQIARRATGAAALVVNEGALQALRANKASLLPIGVLEVVGTFARGEAVELRDESGRVHGQGLVNYDARESRVIAGAHSRDLARLLGYRGYDAIVTRDHLVLTEI